MKTKSDPRREDALLDILLCDETWQVASAGFKAEALRTLHARRRVRRLTRWAGSAAALAAMIAGVTLWLGRSTSAPRHITLARNEAPKATKQPGHLTDQALVAAFPRGSCFIAEVDGRKELIFMDPKVQRTYVARPVVSGDRESN